MLESKFKIAFLLTVLVFAALPILAIIRGTTLTPFEDSPHDSTDVTSSDSLDSSEVSREEPVDRVQLAGAGPIMTAWCCCTRIFDSM